MGRLIDLSMEVRAKHTNKLLGWLIQPDFPIEEFVRNKVVVIPVWRMDPVTHEPCRGINEPSCHCIYIEYGQTVINMGDGELPRIDSSFILIGEESQKYITDHAGFCPLSKHQECIEYVAACQ